MNSTFTSHIVLSPFSWCIYIILYLFLFVNT
nr:MAG TPA: hypothetical protein [Caudoviricetes sp.]